MNEIEKLTRCVNRLRDKASKRGLNDSECEKLRNALYELKRYKESCLENANLEKDNSHNPKLINVMM